MSLSVYKLSTVCESSFQFYGEYKENTFAKLPLRTAVLGLQGGGQHLDQPRPLDYWEQVLSGLILLAAGRALDWGDN